MHGSMNVKFIIVFCFWPEFQFLSFPAHSKLSSRSEFPVFHVPNQPPSLGYNISLSCALELQIKKLFWHTLHLELSFCGPHTALWLNNSVLLTRRHDGDAFLRRQTQAVNIDCQVPEYRTAVWYIPVGTFIPVRLRKELGCCVMSGFDVQVDATCTLLGHYATCSVNFLPEFQGTLSVPSLRVEYRS
jgi:hypothetical protein